MKARKRKNAKVAYIHEIKTLGATSLLHSQLSITMNLTIYWVSWAITLT